MNAGETPRFLSPRQERLLWVAVYAVYAFYALILVMEGHGDDTGLQGLFSATLLLVVVGTFLLALTAEPRWIVWHFIAFSLIILVPAYMSAVDARERTGSQWSFEVDQKLLALFAIVWLLFYGAGRLVRRLVDRRGATSER